MSRKRRPQIEGTKHPHAIWVMRRIDHKHCEGPERRVPTDLQADCPSGTRFLVKYLTTRCSAISCQAGRVVASIQCICYCGVKGRVPKRNLRRQCMQESFQLRQLIGVRVCEAGTDEVVHYSSYRKPLEVNWYSLKLHPSGGQLDLDKESAIALLQIPVNVICRNNHSDSRFAQIAAPADQGQSGIHRALLNRLRRSKGNTNFQLHRAAAKHAPARGSCSHEENRLLEKPEGLTLRHKMYHIWSNTCHFTGRKGSAKFLGSACKGFHSSRSFQTQALFLKRRFRRDFSRRWVLSLLGFSLFAACPRAFDPSSHPFPHKSDRSFISFSTSSTNFDRNWIRQIWPNRTWPNRTWPNRTLIK